MSNAASRDAPPGSYVANHAVGTLEASSTAAAAPALLERVARRSWSCLSAGHETGHARDDLRIDIQRLVVQELGERAVGNTKTHVYWLELFVGERPDTTSRFNRGQRCEKCVNRVRTLGAARRGRRRSAAASSSAAATTATKSSTCATESAITATESATATAESPATIATESAASARPRRAAIAAESAASARPRRAACPPLAARASRLPV